MKKNKIDLSRTKTILKDRVNFNFQILNKFKHKIKEEIKDYYIVQNLINHE